MQWLVSILKNRNTLLVAAIVLGLTFGDYAHFIKHLTFYLLAIVLSFSTTGIVFSELSSKRQIASYMSTGFLLNYLLFGTVLLVVAYYLSASTEIFYGFVVIVATPPGVAIIPFSYMLKGDINKATLGTLGGFLASVVLAPFIIKYFTGNDSMRILPLFLNMVFIILIPMMLSRILLLKAIKPFTLKARGKIVNFGFAIIIFTAIGVNRDILLSDFKTILNIALIFFIAMFILGQAYDLLLKKLKVDKPTRISQNLLITLKSSGFSVVTALELFDGTAVIPSALMSIFVLAYLLFLSFKAHFFS